MTPTWNWLPVGGQSGGSDEKRFRILDREVSGEREKREVRPYILIRYNDREDRDRRVIVVVLKK